MNSMTSLPLVGLMLALSQIILWILLKLRLAFWTAKIVGLVLVFEPGIGFVSVDFSPADRIMVEHSLPPRRLDQTNGVCVFELVIFTSPVAFVSSHLTSSLRRIGGADPDSPPFAFRPPLSHRGLLRVPLE